MVSRSILLAMLVVALGGCFLIEQPGSSRITIYPRWEEWVFRFRSVWTAAWWARLWGALTPFLAFDVNHILGLLSAIGFYPLRFQTCLNHLELILASQEATQSMVQFQVCVSLGQGQAYPRTERQLHCENNDQNEKRKQDFLLW